ncbi:hypothetical protein GE061_012565 [Apolygus lucorum]|uniref:Chitin-binding type-2 domain-containing protein n=1 Tax=Apolygus lucorum TaxID=248454 RepID=A0A8S9XSY9_APOLU|nr:hypothetical protein GE061_012565 [Apolygus lucorum]
MAKASGDEISNLAHKEMQHKRQIFREQVLPHAGGKIPEDAFRSDRLALNRLNALGIAIPDGLLLEARAPEAHYKSLRTDPDIRKSIIKLVQKPDGRYAPPEGHYPFNNLVESTYIIRPHANVPHLQVPPRTPIEVNLRLPAQPFFSQDAASEDIFNINNVDGHFDLLNAYNVDYPGARLWTGFGTFLHDHSNRILRQTNNNLMAQLLQTKPTLSSIPKTGFKCPQLKKGYIMVPDLATACQAFHLCHTDGSKESFLCPHGMRFDPTKKLCHTWTDVPCLPS